MRVFRRVEITETLDETSHLVDSGVKEIMIIAQDTTLMVGIYQKRYT
ncbi:MAG: hypothetical protein CM1200mP10_32780 [Candidatus Neomarinimicrobiota bacterium]|nr:MAG: hypothetical protein CM1200mP10_32780 [Candidatus Neomarinimicrobiota bacterium]